MDRREFIMTASGTAIVAALPTSALVAPAPLKPVLVLKWSAVNLRESIEEYAIEYVQPSGCMSLGPLHFYSLKEPSDASSG